MALKTGYSYATALENIAALVKEGKSLPQATAMSFANARADYFKRYPKGALPSWLVPPGGSRLKPKTTARKKNPVPASSRADEKEAARLYERFTGHDAQEAGRIEKPVIPEALAMIGTCDGILYTTVRDGVTEKYIHKFKAAARPIFAVSPDGSQIYLLGGDYNFTERGIVDNA